MTANPNGSNPRAPTDTLPPALTGICPAMEIASSIAVIAGLIQQDLKNTDTLIQQTHKQTSELVASTHTQAMQRIEEAEGTMRTLTQFGEVIPRGIAECNRLLGRTETLLGRTEALLGRAEGMVGSIQSAQKQLDDALVKETAAATGGRRELWTEAARFGDQIGWQLRWFIRTPAIVLALTAFLRAIWLLRRPSALPLKRSPDQLVLTPPAAKVKAASKKAVSAQQRLPGAMNRAP